MTTLRTSSIILGTICFSKRLGSSIHGFVFTSIRMVFSYSSIIKSYPKSSKVCFQQVILPRTLLQESIISFTISSLKFLTSSSFVLLSLLYFFSWVMNSNKLWVDIILPSSNFSYSAPSFQMALFVSCIVIYSSKGRFGLYSAYSFDDRRT